MIGQRIGPYEVVAKLGEGGMGEVYRARDSRLNREVAVKVLPTTFASDPERLARLTREAQTLASLSHANIAHVYGLEQSGAAPALVMELVEGPTLEDLIRKSIKGVTLADALPLAAQIAAGLEAAHDKGVIHRDLKPANIKVQDDGVVKILDFGLAKAIDPMAMSGESLSNSPTLTGRMTQLGAILGTAAYMAPEQARGKIVDRRADIWAFGCVLYEMLTARRPFEGTDIADVLAKILEREPDMTVLPAPTPQAIRRLIARCLIKDPRQRLRDIGEARIMIEDVVAGRTEPAPAPPSAMAARYSRVPWAAAALAVVIAAASWAWPRDAAVTVNAPVMRLTIEIPAEVEVFSPPQISANGQTIAFVGVRQGIRQAYYRRLSESEVHVVRGSEAGAPGSALAISPDGNALAFVSSDGRLFRVPLESGLMQMMDAKAEFLSSLSWINDELVYSNGQQVVRRKVGGGEQSTLTPLDAAGGETGQDFPVASTTVPLVGFRSLRAGNALAQFDAVAMDTGRRFPSVMPADHQMRWMSSTQVVYSRGDALLVAPFDASNPKLDGSGTPIVTDVGSVIGGLIGASISDNGSIIYVPSTARNSQLVWVAPNGAETPLPLGARSYQNPRVSPDGTLIAFTGADGLWVIDQRGSVTRASSSNVGFPNWMPDSRRIIVRELAGRLLIVNADGSGTSAMIPSSTSADWPAAVTPDGKAVLVIRLNSATRGDIYVVPVDGGEARAVIATPAYDGSPQISKDGKWLLYSSDESGKMDIYLRRFDTASGHRTTISTNGGMHPIWSRDGKRVYYRNGQQMMAVDVTLEPEVKLGKPQLLFERRYEFGPNISQANYSINIDNQRLLMVKPDPSAQSLQLILNWPGLVKR